MLSINWPRATYTERSAPFCTMAMPVVACSTSSRFRMDWSSMRWRVTTVTDCGVSRCDRFRRVALLVTCTT
ncbi:hypothetical protein D3C72_2537630 [compost metagenome]